MADLSHFLTTFCDTLKATVAGETTLESPIISAIKAKFLATPYEELTSDFIKGLASADFAIITGEFTHTLGPKDVDTKMYKLSASMGATKEKMALVLSAEASSARRFTECLSLGKNFASDLIRCLGDVLATNTDATPAGAVVTALKQTQGELSSLVAAAVTEAASETASETASTVCEGAVCESGACESGVCESGAVCEAVCGCESK